MANPIHQDYIITQNFGPTSVPVEPAYGGYAHYHGAWDYVPKNRPAKNCPIFATNPGKVHAAGADGGNYVIILLDSGHWEFHWHLNRIDVKAGQRVDNSVQIGLMGSTGNVISTNGNDPSHDHLGFAMPGPWKGVYGMTPTDPRPFIANVSGTPGEGEDMWEDFVRLVYATYFPSQKPTDKTITDHANHLRGLTLEQREGWLREFMTDSDQYVTPHKVLATYWAAKGGSDPDQYANERLAGGATIASVLNGDLPADAKALKDAQEQKAATDAALTDATNHQRALDAQILAQKEDIRNLNSALEKTDTPPADVSLKGLRLLGDYLVRLTKKEQKGGGK